jgi:uncharacterized membrane protein
MSPAINDPFTVMTCLDHLGDGLAKFVRQEERGGPYYDRQGRLRLVLELVNFAELVDAAFDMLRHASCDNASVLLHMLAVIDVIGREAKAPEARQLLPRAGYYQRLQSPAAQHRVHLTHNSGRRARSLAPPAQWVDCARSRCEGGRRQQ